MRSIPSTRSVVQACGLAVALLALTCLESPLFAADISGRITVTKRLTRKRVTLANYDLRGGAVGEPLQSGAGEEYSRMVVFVEGPGLEARPSQAEMVQRNRRFEPEVLAVPIGSQVSFPNFDPIFHNVFSLSKAKEFDLGYYPKSQTRLVRFDQPGVVQVYCHLHANMQAAILVVPTRVYARPGSDGSFSFPSLQPGEYRITAWHKTAGFFRKSIQVGAEGATPIHFEIPVSVPEEVQ